ncbi:hypothetical protein LRY65_00855 [Candidatus Woesebacteria bacterium]|nr:hypothetical protein [Candidatus Woesebacteria bacterium]MCD8507670.1 hypothetical protein [Candidatus Woesebacteria bacterium]MCD8526747.1 hypothetical protein [Candidatus Woesebacteria bacterium]MCD8546510.1 hypothetical protein [Candidatus Woesebacteria bacterium]
MTKKKLVAAGSSVVGFLTAAGAALAQSVPQVTVDQDQANIKITDVGRLLSSAIGAALLISAILVFGYLILGGIQWITSGGDKGKTESARNKITAALVGLAIVASSYAIMQIIAYFFGINIFGSGISDTLQQIKPY